jgi:hypothetical protein
VLSDACGGAADLEILSAVEGAFLNKIAVDRGVNGGEFLRCSRAAKSQLGALTPSKRLMGILGVMVHTILAAILGLRAPVACA